MRPDVQILLSGSLTFGVPLILAVRELVALRRGGGPGWRPDGHEPEPFPQPPPELPACLRPPFPNTLQEDHEWSPRVLEPV